MTRTFQPSIDVRQRRRLFGAACLSIFVFGIVLAILGTLFGLPEMRARLHIDLAQQGDIFLVLFAGVLLSTLIAGPIMDGMGHKVVLVSSAALVALALLLLMRASSFASGAVATLVLGFGGGGLNTSANALVADAYIENRAPMLLILGTFFGFGALVIPLLAASITGAFTIPQLLVANALLAAFCAAACAILRFPPAREGTGISLLASFRAASIPGVLLFASVLFFQSGNESSIGGWVSTYAGAMGASSRSATWILAGYWAALMTGRLLMARLPPSVPPERIVLGCGIGSVVGCAVLLTAGSVAVMATGATIAGLSFAAVYPTTLAMAADRYQRMAGTIFGLLFAIGLAGGMVFPWGVGHLSEVFGLRTAMALPIAGGAAVSLLSFVIHRVK